MKKNSRMQFDLGSNTNQLTIKYTNNFDVDKDSYINFENVYRKNMISPSLNSPERSNSIQTIPKLTSVGA